MRLEERVAIVTGAGSEGIGRAVCLRFAQEGAAVAALDVEEAGALETARQIRAVGGRAMGLRVDITAEHEIDYAVKQVIDAFGPIDVLVNSAGVMHNARVEDESSAGWDRILDTNLKGVYLCCKHVVPHMRRDAGAIVNVGSVTGIMGFPRLAAYCASKGGLHSLTRAMAIDYAREGIRVNAVAPGTVDTPILHGFLKETDDPARARAAFDAIHPVGRVATPEDIAHVVLFLASREAAFVTGHVLVADGGYSIAGNQPNG